MQISRRRVLQIGSAGAVAAAVPTFSSARLPVTRARAPSAPRAMNLVFMVADGMSYSTLTLADACHRQRFDRSSTWISLFNEKAVRRSTAFTYSADSHVTDSAAGATAWGIGERVNNHCVCVTPDDRRPTPLWVQAKQQGKAVGLVTTTTLTHATPAGFIANIPDRNLEREIGVQMMERGFDVALGGGRMFFPDATLKLRSDVSVITNTAGLRAAGAGGPLLGLFSTGHMAYALDRPEEQPDLEEMTRAALARLFTAPHGFTLMIEGGRVDHAGHANDAAAIVHEQLAFDRAVAAVWELTRERDDTLVIVTTDHGNSNPALTSTHPKTKDGIRLLNDARRSFESMFRAAMREVKGEDGAPLPDQHSAEAAAARVTHLAELTRTELGIGLSSEHRDVLVASLAGKHVDPFSERQSFTSVFGSVLANYNCVAFLSANHTSDMVEVTSWGPGSDQIAPMIRNYDLHGVAVRALDLAPAKPV